MKRRITQVALVLAFLLITAVAWLRLTAVPARKFPYRFWTDPSQGPEITADAALLRMVARAERDYWFSPLPERRGELKFVVAHSVPPNDVYLAFSRADSEELVIYRGAREDGRLLWKAVWNQFD